ncbi:MAG: hypothetical protein ACREMY_13955 [bacterium]
MTRSGPFEPKNATLLADLAHALADPLGVEIVLCLTLEPGSARSVAAALDIPPTVASEQLSRLAESGIVEPVSTEENAEHSEETTYRVDCDAMQGRLEWFFALAVLVSTAVAAAKAGLLAGPPAATVIFRPIAVDSDGWRKVARALKDAREKISAIEQASAARLEGEGGINGMAIVPDDPPRQRRNGRVPPMSRTSSDATHSSIPNLTDQGGAIAAGDEHAGLGSSFASFTP